MGGAGDDVDFGVDFYGEDGRVEGDVAEDGEGAAVVASTLRHRECSVTVVIALFLQILWRLFRIFSLLFF